MDRHRLLMMALIGLSCHQAVAPVDLHRIMGNYQGRLGGGLVRVVLFYANGDSVAGYDLRGGDRRNLLGVVEPNGSSLDMELAEPGERTTDGTFQVHLDTVTLKMTGVWQPLHSDGPEQKLALQRDSTPPATKSYLENQPVMWGQHNDTVLLLNRDGYCTFQFTPRSSNPDSQTMEVSGTFTLSGDSCMIEWQQNPYTPGRHMTLIRVSKPDTGQVLKGQGWVLTGP